MSAKKKSNNLKSSKRKPNHSKSNVGKKKNSTSNNKKASDLKGIVAITIGVMMLFSILSKYISGLSMGDFGDISHKYLTAFLGFGALIFPIFVIVISLMYIVNNGVIKFTPKFYGIILILISFLLLLNNINYNKFYVSSDIKIAFEKFFESKSLFHGGILSFLILVPLNSFFGRTGSAILISMSLFMSIMLILQVELSSIILKIKELVGIKVRGNLKNRSDKLLDQAEKKNLIDEEIKKKSEKYYDSTEDVNQFEKEESRVKIIDFLKSNQVSDETVVKENAIRNEISDKRPVIVNSNSVDKIKDDIFKDKESSQETMNLTSGVTKEIEIKSHDELDSIKEYVFPSIDFLKENKSNAQNSNEMKALLQRSNTLTNTLKSFGVKATVIRVTKGPSVTRFEIQPEIGVKVSKIVNLSDDIALNLAAQSIRIEAPIPGKAAVGIEVPNKKLVPVLFREIIESDNFKKDKGKLTTGLGKDISGTSITADLAKMPHVLVAGATGSGKSVCINSLIISLLYKYSPDEVKLLMIDPKVVELNVYNGIPHLLIPVVTDPRKAAGALGWAVGEMERRYKAFADNGAKNIDGYNELFDKGIIEEKMPYIVIVIDELADLMMVSPKDVEGYIARLAQMARAAGMHLVIATQRPSVDVITGMIKANIPSRIAFAVSSQVDSRTIIDSSGAEKLLGKGDMLFLPIGASKPTRIQGAFISESEVEEIVSFIKIDKDENSYQTNIIDAIEESSSSNEIGSQEVDPLLNEAIDFVVIQKKASTSMIQRKFKIGYNRAARIIDNMEERGVISGANGSKPRQILLDTIDVK